MKLTSSNEPAGSSSPRGALRWRHVEAQRGADGQDDGPAKEYAAALKAAETLLGYSALLTTALVHEAGITCKAIRAFKGKIATTDRATAALILGCRPSQVGYCARCQGLTCDTGPMPRSSAPPAARPGRTQARSPADHPAADSPP